jgi:hypothetical protein
VQLIDQGKVNAEELTTEIGISPDSLIPTLAVMLLITSFTFCSFLERCFYPLTVAVCSLLDLFSPGS